MPLQGERQNYLWRPNDNSSTTRLRYDLEAEHWYKSLKEAEKKDKSVSLGEMLEIIGYFIDLVFSLEILITYVIIYVIKWLRSNK